MQAKKESKRMVKSLPVHAVNVAYEKFRVNV